MIRKLGLLALTAIAFAPDHRAGTSAGMTGIADSNRLTRSEVEAYDAQTKTPTVEQSLALSQERLERCFMLTESLQSKVNGPAPSCPPSVTSVTPADGIAGMAYRLSLALDHLGDRLGTLSSQLS